MRITPKKKFSMCVPPLTAGKITIPVMAEIKSARIGDINQYLPLDFIGKM